MLQPLNQLANITHVVLPVLIQKWMKPPSGEQDYKLWQDRVLTGSPCALQRQNPESLMTENITQENVLIYGLGLPLHYSGFRTIDPQEWTDFRILYSKCSLSRSPGHSFVSFMIRFHLHSWTQSKEKKKNKRLKRIHNWKMRRHDLLRNSKISLEMREGWGGGQWPGQVS